MLIYRDYPGYFPRCGIGRKPNNIEISRSGHSIQFYTISTRLFLSTTSWWSHHHDHRPSHTTLNLLPFLPLLPRTPTTTNTPLQTHRRPPDKKSPETSLRHAHQAAHSRCWTPLWWATGSRGVLRELMWSVRDGFMARRNRGMEGKMGWRGCREQLPREEKRRQRWIGLVGIVWC